MKITIAQLNYHIGNFEFNIRKMMGAIDQAEKENSDLIIFSELALTGYPAGDLLDYEDFVTQSQEALAKIISYKPSIARIIGSPTVNPKVEGKNLFNSAVFAVGGEIKHIINKGLLPTYDVFDEYRYFEPASSFSVIKFKEHTIAVTICEDLWDVEEDKMYLQKPMDTLCTQKPDLMINIAASPFDYDHAEKRKMVLAENVTTYGLPLVYVNHIGAQTELVFDGGSLVFDNKANIQHELAYFQEEVKTIDLKVKATELQVKKDKIELIHSALVLGIQDYFKKMGFKKAILGLSGGIDSALTMALAAEALGSENVHGVLMPSEYSSDHSVNDAVKLAENLGCSYETVAIKDIFDTFQASLKPTFQGKGFDLTEENLQARIRGVILMAISNKHGYILLNTSNKSEMAVGYGTLYGDMCGGIAVLGDVYKTQVYELSRFINRSKEIIPVNTIEKAPSAELRPGQKDSDSLPPYDALDSILYNFIERKKTQDQIIKEGFDKETVKKVTALVNRNEYKRYQTPPVIRVSSKSFGPGRRIPIVSVFK